MPDRENKQNFINTSSFPPLPASCFLPSSSLDHNKITKSLQRNRSFPVSLLKSSVFPILQVAIMSIPTEQWAQVIEKTGGRT